MTAAPQELYVFLHGEMIGCAVRSLRGAVHFEYRDDLTPSVVPLSLSLPIRRRGRLDILPWLDGLLPDNPRTRSRWMRELSAASTASFDLLCTQAGLECAGAVQLYPEPVLPDLQSETLTRLTDSELAAMLNLIAQDADNVPSAGMGELRLSLPGAQPKMALRLTDDGWHLPTGSLATTHILKPQRGHLNLAVRDSITVNEHLCQQAAGALGLRAARTSVAVFGDEICLVAERFDRHYSDTAVHRLHFEDLCQALGFPPSLRYQSDGGPSAVTVINMLRDETSRDDQRNFLLSLFYNWLIGNTDGHSKNYGILLTSGPPVLAPLYDLSSAAPYAVPDTQTIQPAMHFGGPALTTLEQWSQTAARLRIAINVDELQDLVQRLPAAFESATSQCPVWAQPAAQMISERVVAHARRAVQSAT